MLQSFEGKVTRSSKSHYVHINTRLTTLRQDFSEVVIAAVQNSVAPLIPLSISLSVSMPGSLSITPPVAACPPDPRGLEFGRTPVLPSVCRYRCLDHVGCQVPPVILIIRGHLLTEGFFSPNISNLVLSTAQTAYKTTAYKTNLVIRQGSSAKICT